jgi:uncharacterized protein DUF3179
VVAIACAVALASCGRDEQVPGAPEPTLGGLPASQFFIQHDEFIWIDEPAVVPADQATFLREDDEVFGIVVQQHARAYPVPMLAYHHVVNDVIEGIPVAVTY